MSNEIIKHWKSDDKELPGVNGIYYADGSVTMMSYTSYKNNVTDEFYTIKFCPQCDTSISSLEKYDAAYWTSADIMTTAVYRGGKLFAGGGAYEETGFLAYEDEQENFVWAIFFENSDAISKIKVQDNSIVVWGDAEFHTQLKITINSNNLTEIHMDVVSTDENP